MTKILYNRAAKTFMDAISEGYDEHGAYDKVEKKHGKVLADAVWAEAQAEMKAIRKNPRIKDTLGRDSGDFPSNPEEIAALATYRDYLERKKKKNPRWDGDTSSGSEYSDLRGRWGLSHADAVAVIEGTKTFKQVKEEWAKKGNKLEPLYDLRGNPRNNTIKITRVQLHMLKWALEDYPKSIYPLGKNRNACVKLTEKELMKTAPSHHTESELNKKYPKYTLTAKGKQLIEKYLKK